MRPFPGLILILTFLFVAACAPPNVAVPTSATETAATQTPAVAFPSAVAPLTLTASPIPSAAAPASATVAPSATPAPTGTSPVTPAPTPVAPGGPAPQMPAAVGVEVFASPALGISFSYLPRQNGQRIAVQEQGDKIYVYPVNMQPTDGQWVQVFAKEPAESLEAAIRRVIMPGYPAADCQVVPVAHPLGRTPQPNFEYAGIVVRREPGEAEETVLARWRTCPQPYTVVGGIGYFQADKLHPDKFLFFSIGQYAILAGRDVPWQETVAFD